MKRKLYRIQKVSPDAKIVADVVLGGDSFEKALASYGVPHPVMFHKCGAIHMFKDDNGWCYNVISGLELEQVA